MGLRESVAEMKPEWLGRHEEVRRGNVKAMGKGAKLKEMAWKVRAMSRISTWTGKYTKCYLTLLDSRFLPSCCIRDHITPFLGQNLCLTLILVTGSCLLDHSALAGIRE